MERCPNCGAPARPNAKFCTTCGYRLPPQEGAASGEAAPVAATAEPGSEAAVDGGSDDDVAAGGGASVDDPDAAWRPAEPADQVDADAASSPDAAGDGQADEVIESTWTAPPADPPWMNAWTTGAIGSEASGADAAASQPPAVTGESDEPGGEQVERIEAAVEGGAVVEEEGALGGAFEAMAVAADDELPPHLASVDRALALLDELRVLVPTLAAGPDDRGRQSAVADALAAAIETDAALDVGGLRDAMERARARPKDIDTVLDLAGRVDAVIALIDAHDRLRGAAGGAVDALRG